MGVSYSCTALYRNGEEFEEVQEAISGVLIEEKRTPEAIKHLQAELCDLAVTAFMLSGGF